MVAKSLCSPKFASQGRSAKVRKLQRNFPAPENKCYSSFAGFATILQNNIERLEV
jgi:hypothetical protein